MNRIRDRKKGNDEGEREGKYSLDERETKIKNTAVSYSLQFWISPSS